MNNQKEYLQTEAEKAQRDRNEDPVTGAPGSHPVASGVGAAAGALAGVGAGGVVGGPVGAAVGAVVGGIIGGLGGKAAGEAIDPTEEEAYWQSNHASQPYGAEGSYEDYHHAYRAGYEGYARHAHRDVRFAEVESDIRSDYEQRKAPLAWEKARPATLSAFSRAYSRHASRAVADRTDGPGTAGNV